MNNIHGKVEQIFNGVNFMSVLLPNILVIWHDALLKLKKNLYLSHLALFMETIKQTLWHFYVRRCKIKFESHSEHWTNWITMLFLEIKGKPMIFRKEKASKIFQKNTGRFLKHSSPISQLKNGFYYLMHLNISCDFILLSAFWNLLSWIYDCQWFFVI